MGWIHNFLKSPLYGKSVNQIKESVSENARYENISVKSESGSDLSVWVARADVKNEKATIVLGHSAENGSGEFFLSSGYVDYLINRGYNLLVFDFNGFGKSTMGNFSFHEDILAVGMKAKEIFPDLPLGYHGVGLGAHWAINAFNDHNHRFSFAILEDASLSWTDLWKTTTKTLFFSRLLKFFFPSLRKNTNFLRRAAGMKNLHSVLFIYSMDDRDTPSSFGEVFTKSCKLITEIWLAKLSEKYTDVYYKKAESYFHKQQLYYYRKFNR